MINPQEHIRSTARLFRKWTIIFLIFFTTAFLFLFLFDSYAFPQLSITGRGVFLFFIFLVVLAAALVVLWWTNKLINEYSITASGGIQLKDLARAVDEFAMVDYSDKNGVIVEANDLFCAYSGYSKDEIVGKDHRILNSGYHPPEFFTALWETVLRGEVWRGEVLEKSRDGAFYWTDTTVVPYMGSGDKSYSFISLRKNITDRVTAESELNKINRFYRFIIAVNETILKQDVRETIFSEACRIAVEEGQFRMAWVGRLDEEQSMVIPVTVAGYSEGYVNSIKVSATDSKFGRGPSGKAIRSGKYHYCNNIATDPDMEPWREKALERGYKSSIALPMVLSDGSRFIYTLYMTEADFFNDVEIKLLLDVCDNIIHALEKILLVQKQQQAERELRESEEKFRFLVEQTLWGVYIYQNHQFQYVNPAFALITGYTKEKLEGQFSFEKLVHDEDLELLREKTEWKISGKGLNDRLVVRIIRSDGDIRSVQIDATVISLNGSPAIIGTLMDVTKIVEEENRIDKATVEAQEKERMEIGMELHDNVKQILAACVLQLDLVHFAETRETRNQEVVKMVQGYLKEAIFELRKLSHQLAPVFDIDQDLRHKIMELASQIAESSKVIFHFDVDPLTGPLDTKIQLTLYRIIQEQFSNVSRHAHCKNVYVTLKELPGQIVLSIADDGVGFDPLQSVKGIGFANIRRRINALNGKLRITSKPGHGCELFILINK